MLNFLLSFIASFNMNIFLPLIKLEVSSIDKVFFINYFTIYIKNRYIVIKTESILQNVIKHFITLLLNLAAILQSLKLKRLVK